MTKTEISYLDSQTNHIRSQEAQESNTVRWFLQEKDEKDESENCFRKTKPKNVSCDLRYCKSSKILKKKH